MKEKTNQINVIYWHIFKTWLLMSMIKFEFKNLKKIAKN